MVIWKRCECGHSEPNFGLFGQPRRMARWCSSCPNKPPDAVDIVHKRCKCGHHRPSMGMPGDKRKDAKWCLKCPTLPKAAVNVLNKMCECGKSRPVFVLPGQTKRDVKWCRQCPDRPEEAIDVISKKCMCGKKQPYFGFPWEKAGEARSPSPQSLWASLARPPAPSGEALNSKSCRWPQVVFRLPRSTSHGDQCQDQEMPVREARGHHGLARPSAQVVQ